MYLIDRTQDLPISLEEAWAFFSSPHNLAKITPKNLGFTVLGEIPETMYEGLFIHYTVSPLAGIPMKWTTEITHIRPMEYFVDEQRVGPYSIWHHEHFLNPSQGAFACETGFITKFRLDFWVASFIRSSSVRVWKRSSPSDLKRRRNFLAPNFVPWLNL